jgi:hypothetical protein
MPNLELLRGHDRTLVELESLRRYLAAEVGLQLASDASGPAVAAGTT